MNFIDKFQEYENEKDYSISYLLMRRAIGIFGFALPLVLIIGSFIPGKLEGIQPSISDYYGTYLRDIFVGVLCAVALFLFSYRGFSRVDTVAANCAAFFALGVAFFPTTSTIPFIHYYHLVSAALFFITLSFISLFLFTLTKDRKPAKGRKRIRNYIYRSCAFIMVGAILLMLVYIAVLEKRYEKLEVIRPIFLLESLALFAFGTSWLVKGRTLWADK